jgi:hypothetical protein
MNEETFRYILITAVVIVPVLAVTARFALRPIVESIARLQEVMRQQNEYTRGNDLGDQVRVLREQNEVLRSELERLRTAEEFHRELAKSPLEDLPPGESRS